MSSPTSALHNRLARLTDESASGVPSRTRVVRGTKGRARATELHDHLSLLLAGASPDALATVTPRAAGYGSRVILRDLDTGAVSTHTLMAGEAMDLEAGHISVDAPLGLALRGRREGDTVEVEAPRGLARFGILEVRTLEALLHEYETALEVALRSTA